ncbi:phosphatase PAP2 family protein [Psychroflexus maritimus]|uniref:Phosphatase PAP2 family protein n=1 Tax=Psychroflexus maritimus TaxID=2714865 RepID=A0A967ACR6_9FLAO|nr:phosphatase PAP2 family protein [Psychroflexus maritimus]NGZ89290.1 phosphatase PAP2 family protein [Psychroflexus maritimus]
MLEWINEIDSNLFLYLNQLGSRKWDWFWIIMTEKWTSIPVFLVLLLLIYKNYNLKKVGVFCLSIFFVILISDQLANLSKHFFERPRPCNEDFMKYGRFLAKRCGSFGFYSAHASTTFALATFFILQVKKKLPKIHYWLIPWAIIVTYSRIYIGVHYPGDIIVGCTIGISIGTLIASLSNKIKFLKVE